MQRTQIQLPDDLYARAKTYSRAKEMSLAELVRQSLEQMLDHVPASPPKDDDWLFPTVDCGGILVPLEDLKYYARDEEAYRSLPHSDEDGES